MRLAAVAFLLLAGCATPPPPEPAAAPTARQMLSSVTVGKSTKSDVRAALGEGTMVNFDSVYEVWVYRQPAVERTKTPAGELVLLFEPSGILTKARVR